MCWIKIFYYSFISISFINYLSAQNFNLDINELKDSNSPYLLSHADNPVYWKEWSNELIKKAQELDKPLIISIGYEACYWCHVMERESFKDKEIAEIMNQNYINIKIDREERPDLDDIYMAAAQIINKRGGWPLNVFALPNGKAFYAGTYFPKASWKKLLLSIHSYYINKRDDCQKNAEIIEKNIENMSLIPFFKATQDSIINKKTYAQTYQLWDEQFDKKWGGMNKAPKFPMPIIWKSLLQNYFYYPNVNTLKTLDITLSKMALGGIFDQIEGGFARYSTDKQWKVPHFEKMLYDNAQLVSLYALAYQFKPLDSYKNVIEKTLTFFQTSMMHKQGGFYASLNAESEHEEGTYYVWTIEELDAILNPEELQLIKQFYSMSQQGNWEHEKNVLWSPLPLNTLAEQKKIPIKSYQQILHSAHGKMLEKRKQRVLPSLDDKVLTAWNAMMAIAYIDAYKAMGNKTYLKIAQKNIDFLLKTLWKDNQLYRSYRNGISHIPAFLIDYAYLIKALINLYEVTFDSQKVTNKNQLPYYILWAKKLTDQVLIKFNDPYNPLLYFASQNMNEGMIRTKEFFDNVVPSSNSIMADALFHLGSLLDEPKYLNRAKLMVRNMGENISNSGPYMANWMNLLGSIAQGPIEIAIMGNNASPLKQELQKSFLPNTYFMGGIENLPLLKGKKKKGKTLIYVCKNKVCRFPVETVEMALKEIEKIRKE